MDRLNISRKTEPVTFTIRIDKSLADYFEALARETNRSRNEVITIALEYAKDKIQIGKWD